MTREYRRPHYDQDRGMDLPHQRTPAPPLTDDCPSCGRDRHGDLCRTCDVSTHCLVRVSETRPDGTVVEPVCGALIRPGGHCPRHGRVA